MTPTYDPLGIAFDPILCTANHSCDPNAIVVMDGSNISFRALTTVKKGSEVFISYIDHTNPYKVRQTELSGRYCFKCVCTKCVRRTNSREDEWLHSASMLPERFSDLCNSLETERNPDYFVGDNKTTNEIRLAQLQGMSFRDLEAGRKFDAARNMGSPWAANAKFERVLVTCSQTGLYPLTRQPYAAARYELSALMLEASRPEKSFYHLIKIYWDIDPVLYPQDFHPVRVVHTWALAKTVIWIYEQREMPMTVELHEEGFDFVVIIWKLLRQLTGLVKKSHGPGRFQNVVDSTLEDVYRGVGGAQNAALMESDPHNQWERFEDMADKLGY